MNSPLENPDQSPPLPPIDAPDKGSVLIGFLVGWGAMIASTFVCGIVIAGAGPLMNWSSAFSVIGLLASLLPLASLVGLIIWYAQKGKSRSAWGVVAAFGSLFF